MLGSSKLTFLCTPNNPLGTTIALADVRRLLLRARGIVVVDEAYIEFSRQRSSTSLTQEFPNLVILRTFSKAWGLAGLRVGAAIGHPSILNVLRMVQDPYTPNGAAQAAILRCCAQYDTIGDSINRVRVERERVRQSLLRCELIERIFPSEANFLLLQFRRPGLQQLLAKNGALISDTSFQISNSARISIGTPEENDMMIAILHRIAASINTEMTYGKQ